jgi:tRNA-splicing ligase RtcB
MTIKRNEESRNVPIKIWTEEVEESALKQLKNTASLPFVFKHVAAMPDVHLGYGATVGSVVATKGAIVPACVGVDIGCGMSAVHLEGIRVSDLTGKLPRLRQAIEKAIPVGMGMHKDREGERVSKPKIWDPVLADMKTVESRSKGPLRNGFKKVVSQLGTLGGGNHFIEVCVGRRPEALAQEEPEVWLMLHSGSRGIGNLIGQHYIQTAKNEMVDAFVKLDDPDLAYFLEGTKSFQDYLFDMRWAQSFAYANRRAMEELALRAIYSTLALSRPKVLHTIDCHHNYVADEVHFGEQVLVTRKGAVRAGRGELGIIPGSMGARSFIVEGLGNKDSFSSCSHGAGRKMSRGEAKRIFDKADLLEQTQGVECRKDLGVLDEIPGAYKDIDVVMANQRDLVQVQRELKQLICVKG